MEKTSWYKGKKKEEEQPGTKESWRRGGGLDRGMRKQQRKQKEGLHTKIKAVMFIPYTKGSKLAQKLRENEEVMVENNWL